MLEQIECVTKTTTIPTEKIMELICKHKELQLNSVTVCEHALGLEDQGIKFYTGKSQEVEYRCLNCNKSKNYSRYSICSKCREKLEAEGDWSVSGTPEPRIALRPFKFFKRNLVVDALKGEAILASKPMNQSTSMLLLFTKKEIYGCWI